LPRTVKFVKKTTLRSVNNKSNLIILSVSTRAYNTRAYRPALGIMSVLILGVRSVLNSTRSRDENIELANDADIVFIRKELFYRLNKIKNNILKLVIKLVFY